MHEAGIHYVSSGLNITSYVGCDFLYQYLLTFTVIPEGSVSLAPFTPQRSVGHFQFVPHANSNVLKMIYMDARLKETPETL